MNSCFYFIAAALESKVSNLEEEMSQERMLAANANRKLEKKIKELTKQLEEERIHADQYKEQNEKVSVMSLLRISSFSKRLLASLKPS